MKLKHNVIITIILILTFLYIKIDIYSNEYRTIEQLNMITKERYNIQETSNSYKIINVELTFYTSLASCCGNNLGITASGVKLNNMTIAVPRKVNSTKPMYNFGTIIEINGYGKKRVEDTGNPKYLKIKPDGRIIIDIFIPREQGESDVEYRKRILNMGRVHTTAKVYV